MILSKMLIVHILFCEVLILLANLILFLLLGKLVRSLKDSSYISLTKRRFNKFLGRLLAESVSSRLGFAFLTRIKQSLWSLRKSAVVSRRGDV